LTSVNISIAKICMHLGRVPRGFHKDWRTEAISWRVFL
jgi:hypothetical protein